MIHALTLAQAVGLVGLYCTVLFALCKLLAHFEGQYERALGKRQKVSATLPTLVATLDRALRVRVERKAEIRQIIVEGRLPELREHEYGFLHEDAYREVIATMIPELVLYARSVQLARWLPFGFLWLWRATVLEILGMLVLVGAVAYEATAQADWSSVYQWCLLLQGGIAVPSMALYIFLKTRDQQLCETNEEHKAM